jgi:hypothetical protein
MGGEPFFLFKMEGPGDRRLYASPAEARMWLNERRRGPGGALPLAGSSSAASRRPPPSAAARRVRTRLPRREDVSPSLLRGRPRRPAARVSGSRSRLRAAGRASAAAEPRPRSRPLGPYYSRRAGGGGGRAGPLKSVRARAGSPPRGAALVAPRLREGGFQAAPPAARGGPWHRGSSCRPTSNPDLFSESVHAALFLPSFLCFYLLLDSMA